MSTSAFSKIIKTLTAAVLGAVGIVGFQTVTAPAASARCLGVGQPVTSKLWARNNGALLAWETPIRDTCNDNGKYGSTLGAASGWFAVVALRDPDNIWWTYDQRELTAGHLGYTDSRHAAVELMCAFRTSTNTGWCGMGTNSWPASYSNWVLTTPHAAARINRGF